MLCADGCQRRAQGPAHCYPRDTAFTQITREQKGPSFEGQRGSKQIVAGTEPSLWERIASLVRQQHYLKRVLQSFLLAEPVIIEGLSPCPSLGETEAQRVGGRTVGHVVSWICPPGVLWLQISILSPGVPGIPFPQPSITELNQKFIPRGP